MSLDSDRQPLVTMGPTLPNFVKAFCMPFTYVRQVLTGQFTQTGSVGPMGILDSDPPGIYVKIWKVILMCSFKKTKTKERQLQCRQNDLSINGEEFMESKNGHNLLLQKAKKTLEINGVGVLINKQQPENIEQS